MVGGKVGFSERSIAGNKLYGDEESLDKGGDKEDVDGILASAVAEAKRWLELDES